MKTAFNEAKSKGIASLWKYYTVMLSLDIPFQIVNFVLFGLVTDAVTMQAGLPANSILTRLLCGVSCGMFSAAVTCPLDVCKTRIISRDKKLQQQLQQQQDQAVQQNEVEILGTQQLSSHMMLNETSAGADYAVYRPPPSDDDYPFETSAVAQLMARPATVSPLANENNTTTVVEVTPMISANRNMVVELATIFKEEGLATLFLGFKQRLLYTGLANGIRLTAYGTSRMDLMMRSLDDL